MDLPSSQSAAEGFLSLLEDDSNPFLLAYKRVNFQLGLARQFIEGVIKRGVASIIKPVSSDELLRDEFNTRKVIVAITSYDKVRDTHLMYMCVINIIFVYLLYLSFYLLFIYLFIYL